MGRKKGENFNRKGVPNKVTKQARELFIETLEGQVRHLKEAFDKVRLDDPVKYLELVAKYAQYFVPKKVDMTSDGEKLTTLQIEFVK